LAFWQGVFGLGQDANPEAIEIYISAACAASWMGSPVRIVTFRGLGYLLEASQFIDGSG